MVHLSKLCCYPNIWLWVRLNFADMLKMERYPLFNFFLFLGQKLTIVERSCTLQGHFSLTYCHVLTAKYSNYLLSYSWFFRHILLYKYSTHYCPEIIFISSLTQQLFNSGYDKWLPSRKYMMSHVFFSQLNTTWKGKLINQIELKPSNAFYICLNTFTKLSLSNILHINFDIYEEYGTPKDKYACLFYISTQLRILS